MANRTATAISCHSTPTYNSSSHPAFHAAGCPTIYHRRPYLIYLEFGESCISAASQMTTIALMGHLLYCSRWARHRLHVHDGLSPSMYVYLATHVLGALFALPYSLYSVGWWSPRMGEPGGEVVDKSPYSSYPLFYTGVLMITYMSVSSTPIFFVTIDRCLAMRVRLSKHLGGSSAAVSRHIAYCCAATVVAIATLQFYFATWELPLREEAVGWCRAVSCFFRRTLGMQLFIAKVTFAALNFSLSLCLFYQFSRLSSAQMKQLMNRLVKFLTVVELALDIVPIIFLTMFNVVVGEVSGNYFGSVAISCTCLEAAICSVFYHVRLVKRGNRVAGVAGAMQSHHLATMKTIPPPKSGIAAISLAVVASPRELGEASYQRSTARDVRL